jgi:hypothetical protein
MDNNTKETCSKRLSITPSLYNKITSLLTNHKTQNDILTEMYELWTKIHHIKDGEDNGR